MKIILYFAQLVLLLGLALALTTCTFDEVCPPEEDQKIVNYINWIASFGDRYKLTKYVINGVDRTSYLDTLGIRNQVIDFTDYNKFRRIEKRPTTKPDTKCRVVTGYGGTSKRDTLFNATGEISEVKHYWISTDKDGDHGLNLGVTRSLYQNGSRYQEYDLVPPSFGNLLTGFGGNVTNANSAIIIATAENSLPSFALTFTLR